MNTNTAAAFHQAVKNFRLVEAEADRLRDEAIRAAHKAALEKNPNFGSGYWEDFRQSDTASWAAIREAENLPQGRRLPAHILCGVENPTEEFLSRTSTREFIRLWTPTA